MSSDASQRQIARRLQEILDKHETPDTALQLLSTQDAGIMKMYGSQLKRVLNDCKAELDLLQQGGWSVESMIDVYNATDSKLKSAIENYEKVLQGEKEGIQGYNLVDNYVEAMREYLYAMVDLYGLRVFTDVFARNYIKEHMS